MRRLFFLLGVLCLTFSISPPALGKPAGQRSAAITAEAGWARERAALRTKAVTDKIRFEAKVLPELVKAGYGTPEILAREWKTDDYYGSYDSYSRDKLGEDSPLRRFSDLVWGFSPFPEVQKGLMQGLLQQDLPRAERIARFSFQCEVLLAAMRGMRGDKVRSHEGLEHAKTEFAYWQGLSQEAKDNAPGTPGRADFLRGQSLLRQFLPRLLALLEEEAPSAHLAAMRQRGMPAYAPWRNEMGAEAPEWRHRFDLSYSALAARAASALWSRRDNKVYTRKAFALLSSGMGTPDARLGALTLLADAPDAHPADVISFAGNDSGLSNAEMCWSGAWRGFYYGMSFGSCNGGESPAERYIRRQPRIVTAKESGPGITVRELPGRPEFKAGASLYMLVESPQSLPERFRKRVSASRRILAGTPLALLASGPRLLELEPKNAEDAALIRWYGNKGAAAGHALLFSSREAAGPLARRISGWHYTLWEEEEGKPRFVFSKPYSASFFKTMLPGMKGRAASLFMGRDEVFWFCLPTLHGEQWYEARPEKGVLPLPAAMTGPVLEISYNQNTINSTTYTRDADILEAVTLLRVWPKPGKTPEQALEFVQQTEEELQKTLPEDSRSRSERQWLQKLLWQSLGTSAEAGVRAVLLEESSKDAYYRAKDAEALLREAGVSAEEPEDADDDDAADGSADDAANNPAGNDAG